MAGFLSGITHHYVFEEDYKRSHAEDSRSTRIRANAERSLEQEAYDMINRSLY